MTNNRPHILVLEDDPSTSETYKMAFEDIAEITVCASGLKGEEVFMKHPERYDLIITDNDMPGKSGMDFLESICHYERPLRLMISTPQLLRAEEAHAKVQTYGGLGFVKKSDNIGMLMKVVGELLNKSNSATLEDYFRVNYSKVN